MSKQSTRPVRGGKVSGTEKGPKIDPRDQRPKRKTLVEEAEMSKDAPGLRRLRGVKKHEPLCAYKHPRS